MYDISKSKNGIIPSLADTLSNDDSIDAIKEYVENSIDNLTENDAIRKIQIVSFVIEAKKTINNFRDYNLIKQTFSFITELYSGTVSYKDIKNIFKILIIQKKEKKNYLQL